MSEARGLLDGLVGIVKMLWVLLMSFVGGKR